MFPFTLCVIYAGDHFNKVFNAIQLAMIREFLGTYTQDMIKVHMYKYNVIKNIIDNQQLINHKGIYTETILTSTGKNHIYVDETPTCFNFSENLQREGQRWPI